MDLVEKLILLQKKLKPNILLQLMAMTGHKSTEMVRRYIKEANIFKNNALNKIKI